MIETLEAPTALDGHQVQWLLHHADDALSRASVSADGARALRVHIEASGAQNRAFPHVHQSLGQGVHLVARCSSR